MAEHIGTLDPRTFGYRAVCAIGRCGWYRDITTGRDEVGREAAEKALRSHAALAHPPVIHIYRDDE